jgi:hypothetical protein
MQGGHVEHRGEIEVKVVQKEKSGGEEGRQKNKKSRWKKKFAPRSLPKIDRPAQPRRL